MNKTLNAKPVIGILGGICSGKSTVAAEFGKLGCAVIDADRIAHALLDQTDVAEKILDSFGRELLDESGRIDRLRLARVVFSNPDKLKSLTDILHPIVLRDVDKLIGKFEQDGTIRAIALDMPLLIEVGWAQRCDKLVFVECLEDLRLERAKKAGFLDENRIKIREKFQISLDTKRDLADNTIENNSDFSSLVRQVADIFSYILGSG